MREEGQTELTESMVQLVCFKLADEEYAVRIIDIQEVIRVGHITPIPQVPPFALGVINLRGNIVSVFDLRSKLRLQQKEFNHSTKIIVANVEGEVFSFIVDEILENVTLDASQIDSAPDVKMTIDKDCVAGLGELQGRMITILNLKKVHETIKKEMI
jgi:purine-binding chemotaxis protein CheW